MNDTIIITKASGEKEPFSAEKLEESLMRAGAEADVAKRIVQEISAKLYPGMRTKKIYRHALQLLRNESRPLAGRYHLKHGIMELGPSGYPFESYVGELLRLQGYRIEVAQIVKGKCVNHEVDVIAEKDSEHFMVECKFHHQPGIACDVKIPLYVQGRFKDVEAAWQQAEEHERKFHQGWVVTNTRLTKDAIQYGTCAGLKLLGWNYPQQNGLKELVDKAGLYPVTCLTTLTRQEKQSLLERRIVLCKSLDEHLLEQIGVSPARRASVLEEAFQLCK